MGNQRQLGGKVKLISWVNEYYKQTNHEKVILCSAVLMFLNNFYAQKVQFKDENLEKSLILQIDSNKNGQIDNEEIDVTVELKLGEKGISDLSGIEQFKNLKYLNLRKNNISDFSLINQLIYLEELVIGDNKKTEILDLMKLTNLRGLYAFKLELKQIKLKSKKIVNLYLQDNDFTKFQTNNFPELSTLNMDGCKQLKELNLTKNSKLEQIYLLGTGIKKLNVSKNLFLQTIYVEENVELEKVEGQENLKPAPIVIQN